LAPSPIGTQALGDVNRTRAKLILGVQAAETLMVENSSKVGEIKKGGI